MVTAIGATFLAGFALPVLADSNPFSISPLATGYDLVSYNKTEEGKCGEGQCGADHSKHAKDDMKKCKEEGKCGEGKCGENEKCADAKPKLESKPADGKVDEGKCGEGMCGAMGE